MKRRKKIRTIKTKKFWLSIIALVVIIGAMYDIVKTATKTRINVWKIGQMIAYFEQHVCFVNDVLKTNE